MDIEDILSNKNLKESLIEYCIFLAEKYNETLSGVYRIKYNDLFPILFHYLSKEKKEELFKSFTTSLNINPILKINEDEIKFKAI